MILAAKGTGKDLVFNGQVPVECMVGLRKEWRALVFASQISLNLGVMAMECRMLRRNGMISDTATPEGTSSDGWRRSSLVLQAVCAMVFHQTEHGTGTPSLVQPYLHTKIGTPAGGRTRVLLHNYICMDGQVWGSSQHM